MPGNSVGGIRGKGRSGLNLLRRPRFPAGRCRSFDIRFLLGGLLVGSLLRQTKLAQSRRLLSVGLSALVLQRLRAALLLLGPESLRIPDGLAFSACRLPVDRKSVV